MIYGGAAGGRPPKLSPNHTPKQSPKRPPKLHPRTPPRSSPSPPKPSYHPTNHPKVGLMPTFGILRGSFWALGVWGNSLGGGELLGLFDIFLMKTEP